MNTHWNENGYSLALAGTPVSTHTWSSGHKKRGREEMEDSEEESQPLKMNRLDKESQ